MPQRKPSGKRAFVLTNQAPTREFALRRVAQRRSYSGDGAQRLRRRLGNELQIGDGPYLSPSSLEVIAEYLRYT